MNYTKTQKTGDSIFQTNELDDLIELILGVLSNCWFAIFGFVFVKMPENWCRNRIK